MNKEPLTVTLNGLSSKIKIPLHLFRCFHSSCWSVKVLNCCWTKSSKLKNGKSKSFGNYIAYCGSGIDVTGGQNNVLIKLNTFENNTNDITINYSSGGTKIITQNNIDNFVQVWRARTHHTIIMTFSETTIP